MKCSSKPVKAWYSELWTLNSCHMISFIFLSTTLQIKNKNKIWKSTKLWMLICILCQDGWQPPVTVPKTAWPQFQAMCAWEAWIHSTDIQILNHLIISALWLGLQASSVVLKVPHWTDHLRSFNAYFYCKKIFFFKNSSMLFLLLLFLMCTFCIGF